MTPKAKENGENPAYPRTPIWDREEEAYCFGQKGFTKREELAARFMAAMIDYAGEASMSQRMAAAEIAFEQADAFLEQSMKGQS